MEPGGRTCPRCGQAAPYHERFCRACGAPLGPAPAPTPPAVALRESHGRTATYVALAVLVSVAVYLVSPDLFYACCVGGGLFVAGLLLVAYVSSAVTSRKSDKTR